MIDQVTYIIHTSTKKRGKRKKKGTFGSMFDKNKIDRREIILLNTEL
jgi:hypothetical protein